MPEKDILIGGFIEIIELCEENNVKVVGIVDNNIVGEFLSIPIIGNDMNINDWKGKYLENKLIITPDQPAVRKKLVLIYRAHNFKFASLTSGSSRISKSSTIKDGVVIQSGVNISSEVFVGEFVKINNNANIMHNVTIGSFTTIAPNAVLLGYVTIGEGCYIGANATILPYVSICDNVTIGAGAVVTKNIDTPYTKYAGVPAKLLK